MVGLGKIAASQKDFDTAIRHFEAALSLQPKATAIHYPLALAYRGKGDLEKATDPCCRSGEIPAPSSSIHCWISWWN